MEKKYFCPQCNSEDLTYYPLAMYHDYKCNHCKHRFDDKDVVIKKVEKTN